MAEKTQKQLSKETGCSQSLISLFETDKVIPGKSLKKAIAKALNRTEDEIFLGGIVEFKKKMSKDKS